MAKKNNPEPTRTCQECFHCEACHLWSNGPISVAVAPRCPQFEPVRYVKIKDLHEMRIMLEEMMKEGGD